jgi:hypothetical protein
VSTTSTASNFISKINQNFPVGGRDNNTQGFRDNFKNITQALNYVDEDIEFLKINSVKLTQTNDFNNNIIKRALFQQCSNLVYDDTENIQTSDVILNYNNGSYQKFKLGAGTHTFSVDNWPSNSKQANMILSVSTGTTSPISINFGATTLINLGPTLLPISVTAEQIFWLWNDGDENTLYVKHLSTFANTSDIVTTNVSATNLISTNLTSVNSNLSNVISTNNSTTNITATVVYSSNIITPKITATNSVVTNSDVENQTIKNSIVIGNSSYTTSSFLKSLLPVGMITLWYGRSTNVPSGWAICDGSNGTPDLRNKFVIGGDADSATSATTSITGSPTVIGGSKDAIIVEHFHTATSVVNDPGHFHNIREYIRPIDGSDSEGDATISSSAGYTSTNYISSTQTNITVETSVSSTGTSGINANLVPYHALYYIMKIN